METAVIVIKRSIKNPKEISFGFFDA